MFKILDLLKNIFKKENYKRVLKNSFLKGIITKGFEENLFYKRDLILNDQE